MNRVLVILLYFCVSLPMFALVDYNQYREQMKQRILKEYPNMGENIYLRVELPEQLPITKEAADQLEGKCNSIINMNGISSLSMVDRFYLTCKVDIIEKNIVSGQPVRISQKVNFRFIVCDIVEKKVFEELHVTVSGIGINETKAMVSCLQKINPKSKLFADFMAGSKKKIVEYYTQLGPVVLTEANALAGTHKWELALNKLLTVPAVSPYYQECQARAVEIYLDEIDHKAGEIYNSARNVWSSNPSQEGGNQALALLDKMPPISRYSSDADALSADILKRVTYLEKREWNFKVEQYRDSIRMERAKLQPVSRNDNSKSSQEDDDASALAGGLLLGGLAGAAIASLLCPPAAPILMIL